MNFQKIKVYWDGLEATLEEFKWIYQEALDFS